MAPPIAGRRAVGALGAAVAVLLSLSTCALFEQFDLTITVSPAGAGSVEPAGGTFFRGKQVALLPTANEGFTFVRFDGDVSAEENIVVMDAPKTVTAVFALDAIEGTIEPEGAGRIDVELVPVAKGYTEGQVLRLTAVANTGWAFSGWNGDLSGGENPQDIAVAGSIAVTAVFVETYTEFDLSETYTGGEAAAYFPDTDGRAELSYTLHLGESPREVYFVFTNTGEAAESASPGVTELSGSFRPAPPPPTRKISPDHLVPRRPALRGTAEAERFNRESGSLLVRGPRSRSTVPALPDSVGDRADFSYDRPEGGVAATCRSVVAVGATTLNIWVADDCWAVGGTKAHVVTQTMVDGLAQLFLREGAGNDIHDWVTGIYGAPWGANNYENLIAATGDLTILLCDIDGDNDAFETEGGVVGFFWAKDNFIRTVDTATVTDGSNERVMFYIYAVILATDHGGSWDITDPWPRETVSTLAHEFQHMIHYFQKTILRAGGGGSETWLNEMCSMVTEDLLADKLGVPGPRGVDFVEYPDGSPGGPDNEGGSLPRFTYYIETPLMLWPLAEEGLGALLNSYAVTYAFGAYLARCYGGAGFMREIVQNEHTGSLAVEAALQADHPGMTFSDVLRGWGAAVLLSDQIDPAERAGYSTGTEGDWFFLSEADAATYRLGSIDLSRYRYQEAPVDHRGPFIWEQIVEPGADYNPYGPGSNYYYRAAEGATGDIAWRITLEHHTRLSVVVRE